MIELVGSEVVSRVGCPESNLLLKDSNLVFLTRIL